ncbi:hypothetical protein [Maricaulis sp.]|uniref:hypothetical protein n=1 Tax=Maricaulis sp. TaxID=1486257 RepID=UPI0026262A4E|nr:hypothetical protein [Maricaulis sp.]
MPPSNYKIPAQRPPLNAAEDRKAEREQAAMALGLELNARRTMRELSRSENQEATHNVIGHVVRWSILIAFGWVVIATSVLFFHYLSPGSWLSPEQIGSLQDLLLTGGVGAGLGQLIKTHMGSTNAD